MINVWYRQAFKFYLLENNYQINMSWLANAYSRESFILTIYFVKIFIYL